MEFSSEFCEPLRMAKELGDALRAARRARGLTLEQVAEQLEISHQAVGQWEKGRTEPSTANLMKVASLYRTDIRQLTHGMVEVMQVPRIGSGDSASVVEDRRPGVGNFDPEFDAPPEERPNARVIGERALRQMPRDIEVLGTAVGGSAGDFRFNGETVEWVRRPPGVANVKGIYAVRVVNESMVPRFEEGELVYVNPHRRPRLGEYVVIELQPNHADRDSPGDAFIKKLKRITPSKVVLEQFNPPKEIEFRGDTVKVMHRVIPWSELLGF
jgi:phage repressor protein C with HTH and peptisase S24 domain/DNA-binding XRE family transcriptional regulator